MGEKENFDTIWHTVDYNYSTKEDMKHSQSNSAWEAPWHVVDYSGHRPGVITIPADADILRITKNWGKK